MTQNEQLLDYFESARTAGFALHLATFEIIVHYNIRHYNVTSTKQDGTLRTQHTNAVKMRVRLAESMPRCLANGDDHGRTAQLQRTACLYNTAEESTGDEGGLEGDCCRGASY